MRLPRITPVLLLAASLQATADLAVIRNEPNLEKRADLASDNAFAAIDRARTAYLAGKDEEYKKALTEIRDSADLCYKSLEDSGKSGRRSPKHFKRADAKMGSVSKKLDALAEEVSFDDRPAVLDLKKHVNEIQDKIVEAIMTKR
jgi:hypothetical protein